MTRKRVMHKMNVFASGLRWLHEVRVGKPKKNELVRPTRCPVKAACLDLSKSFFATMILVSIS